MYTVHIWVKRKQDMDPEAFRDHWLNRHAPIARDGYEHLKGYVVHLATGAPKGQEPLFDGVAELTWDSREDFGADMRSDAAKAGTEDLERFADSFGLTFTERHVVK